MAKVQRRYEQGSITNEERYFDVINIWSHASEAVAKDMQEGLKNDQDGPEPHLYHGPPPARAVTWPRSASWRVCVA